MRHVSSCRMHVLKEHPVLGERLGTAHMGQGSHGPWPMYRSGPIWGHMGLAGTGTAHGFSLNGLGPY